MNAILKFRSRGEFVTLLQFRLKELGYDVTVDGTYGGGTRTVVRKFQKDNKLKADGQVGPQTWMKLEELFVKKKNTIDLKNSKNPDLVGALKLRSTGPLVQLMQERLSALGYIIFIDGKFGVGTERVVKQFQKDNKLTEDGIVGVITWQKILTTTVAPPKDKKNAPTPNKGSIDRAFFFSEIKKQKLFSSIKQSQVKGMNFILDGWEKSPHTDLRWLAYMLATTYHETARTMLPIAEYGKGRGRPYGSKIKMNRNRYSTPDQIYYGRGYVQLTWYENYDKMGKVLGVDLMNKPELAMDPSNAFEIMQEGMTLGLTGRGDFTGHSLERYFNQTKEDWNNARKIINGNDKKVTIGNYGKKFHAALRHA